MLTHQGAACGVGGVDSLPYRASFALCVFGGGAADSEELICGTPRPNDARGRGIAIVVPGAARARNRRLLSDGINSGLFSAASSQYEPQDKPRDK
ncbi:MAG TPA: hypothetical protein VL137_12125 [Polyangiaceae bacterium]|nr:hypothetical protein [Polyangiaceae bacterium]